MHQVALDILLDREENKNAKAKEKLLKWDDNAQAKKTRPLWLRKTIIIKIKSKIIKSW